jgi:ribonucleoside-diphosphate reductase alpha chain
MTTQHNYILNSGGLVHNGGGKRNGSFAIYLEPWHADIEMFLQMRKNHGDEELKARDLFYALWIPDLFMERVKTNGKWTLMCPDECPGLSNVYGQEFVDLYTKYEKTGQCRQTLNARDLWFQILDAQMETGTPYILYKDASNRKSNQQNIGIIKSSNLCCEILQVSSEKETAVCNLASIALPTFINNVTPNQHTAVFDYEKLHAITKVVTYNLNQIIDVNFYPTEKTERSNKRHRPIGIGIQGLADVFMIMNMAFNSDAAKQLNKDIFETMYHAALEQSCDMAITDGAYETFDGSPASKGILQFDMWNVDPTNARYDWTALKNRIKIHGLRNSLLLAPMPTASTSQILGFNECIEPITSNIYNRRTIAGEFILANKYLMHDLINLGIWNDKVKNSIIANHGSIQHLDIVPVEIREKYKTVWEIPMRALIDMAADRGAFICQSQSLNLWLEDPNYSTLTAMHFHSWTKGLKTGIYYLRRRGRHQAQQFTIEPEKNNNSLVNTKSLEPDICEMCSS